MVGKGADTYLRSEGTMLLSEAVETYLAHLKARRLSPHSIKTARTHFRCLLRGLSHWPTYADLVRWQSAQSVGATTMHLRIGWVRGFFAWCVDMEYIDRSPAEKLPKPKRPKRLPRALSDAQMETLLEWTPTYSRDQDHLLPARDRALLRVMMFTGLRRAEIAALNVGDVNPATRSIAVHGGKGDRDRTVVYPPSLDLIPLTAGRKLTEPLFFGSYKRKRMAPDSIGLMFKRKLAPDVGLHITPHVLRHSYATYLARHGADIMRIKTLLGHSSVATTQMYLEVTGEDLRGAVALLDELAAGA